MRAVRENDECTLAYRRIDGVLMFGMGDRERNSNPEVTEKTVNNSPWPSWPPWSN